MSGSRIMIVDDDKEFLEELQETLLLSGYEVIAINESSAVLETAHKTRPDIILLDLKMPVKSGFEVAEELKTSDELSGIPIITMSGFFRDDLTAKRQLNKPFNPLDVIARIEKELHKK